MSTDPTVSPSTLLACPFCGRNPHSGPTKAELCQMHGEPIQRFAIWCPTGHARIVEPNRQLAEMAWNTTFNRRSEQPSRVSP